MSPHPQRVAYVLEIVLEQMTQYGAAWRADWSDFDGRQLRSQLDGIAAWARAAIENPTLPDFTGGGDFYREHTA